MLANKVRQSARLRFSKPTSLLALSFVLCLQSARAQYAVFPEAIEAADRVDAAGRRGQQPGAPQAGGGLVEQVIGKFQIAPLQPPAAAPQADVLQVQLEENQIQVAPAVPAPPADDGQLNAAEQKKLVSLQRMLTRELEFARQACGLSPEQVQAVSDVCQADLKSITKSIVKAISQPRRVVQINGGQRIEPPRPDQPQLIQDSILAAMKVAKLPEKAKAYQYELGERALYQKQMAIEAFVAAIDQRLYLDSAQREKLAEALERNWDESWTPYARNALYSHNFNPPVPNQILLPLLRQDQKDVWQAPIQNNAGVIFGDAQFVVPVGNGFGGGGF